MTFNDNAQLDTSQVQSGGSGGGFGGGGGIGGGPVIGGVGGIILMIIFGLFNLVGNHGGTTGSNRDSGGYSNGSDQSGGYGNSLSGYARDTNSVDGSGDQISQEISQCKTGADANTHDICRIVGTVNAVQSYWNTALPKFTNGRTTYEDVPTVIFSGQTSSGCGTASSEMGPFYCPTDRKVYIDAAFYKELTSKYGADDGALAKEYVLAHEYGHHVQDLLGTMDQAQQLGSQGASSGSVRLELQADCYAGVWANHATGTTDESGVKIISSISDQDIQDGLQAAQAIGDDAIQGGSGGGVNPDSFTHGTSQQRYTWFKRGIDTGDMAQCDTFSGSI